MSTTQPTPAAAPGQADDGEPRKHNWWIWATALLLAVVTALLVWGLNARADRNNSQQAYQDAYSQLQKELGTANEDLAATQKDLEAAEQRADQAEKDAATAKDDAAAAQAQASKASGKTEQAAAQVDQANADAQQAQKDAEAAQAHSALVTDCAQASVATLKDMFSSDDPEAAAAAAKEELQKLAPQCSGVLSGK